MFRSRTLQYSAVQCSTVIHIAGVVLSNKFPQNIYPLEGSLCAIVIGSETIIKNKKKKNLKFEIYPFIIIGLVEFGLQTMNHYKV